MKYFPLDKLINKALYSPFLRKKAISLKNIVKVESIGIVTKIKFEKYITIFNMKIYSKIFPIIESSLKITKK